MTIDELEKFYKKVRDNENEITDRQCVADALSRELYDLNIVSEKKDVVIFIWFNVKNVFFGN